MSLDSNGRSSLNLTRQDDDLRTRLFKRYGVFSSLLLVGLLIFASAVRNRWEQSAQRAHEALAQAIAADVTLPLDTDYLTNELHILLTVAEVEPTAVILVLNPAGQLIWQHEDGLHLSTEPIWVRWQEGVIHTAVSASSGTWVTTDPTQQEWLHARATTRDGGTVMIQQPTDVAFAASHFLSNALWVTIGIYVAGSLFAWLLLRRLVIIPLERIEASSQRIRWRGETHGEEQQHLHDLGERPDQIGNLARSLLVMEQDIKKRFVQLSTLLETSRVVASSLHLEQVLDNILDQVQQLFGVERCAVVALDQRSGTFRIRASRGLSETYVSQLRIAPTEPNSTSMRALRNQAPVQVSDTETD
jgi:hypothetical protein